MQVEVSEDIFSDEVKVLEGLSKRIQKDMKDLLGITASVKLVEPKTIQRSESTSHLRVRGYPFRWKLRQHFSVRSFHVYK